MASLHHCYIRLHPPSKSLTRYLTAFPTSITYQPRKTELISHLCSTRQAPSTPSSSKWHMAKNRDVISGGLTSLININHHILHVSSSHHRKNTSFPDYRKLLILALFISRLGKSRNLSNENVMFPVNGKFISEGTDYTKKRA